jgi:hypothetical protein
MASLWMELSHVPRMQAFKNLANNHILNYLVEFEGLHVEIHALQL